jgi:hypothetical protein
MTWLLKQRFILLTSHGLFAYMSLIGTDALRQTIAAGLSAEVMTILGAYFTVKHLETKAQAQANAPREPKAND